VGVLLGVEMVAARVSGIEAEIIGTTTTGSCFVISGIEAAMVTPNTRTTVLIPVRIFFLKLLHPHRSITE
jgi:hypothetical protein